MPNVLVNDDSLKAIGNAIREKNGETTTYKPAEMAAAITAISGGGEATIEALSITSNGTYNAPDGVDGYNPITVNVPQDGAPTDNDLTLTGDCSYGCSPQLANWVLRNYKNRITTKNVTDATRMFYSCQVKNIPFVLNTMTNYTQGLSNLFSNSYIKEINNDFFKNVKYTTSSSSLRYCDNSNIFYSCRALRKLPDLSFISVYDNNFVSSYTYNFYSSLLENCYALDEVVDLPVVYSPPTSQNYFQYTFTNCYRLKKLTFGTVYNLGRWGRQTIDLTTVGRINNFTTDINLYSNYSDITSDKQVKDDATYQALKNDPDWFSASWYYSRYNHDSAVETINSLPDCSVYAAAQGINTIKFKGISGRDTDGGAINTLTEEEIAVATAKGWTVTLS